MMIDDRLDATLRVMAAVARDEDPADPDLLICDPAALLAAQRRERRRDPLTAADVDAALPWRTDP